MHVLPGRSGLASPWRTSGSSSWQFARTCPCRSCTCELFLAPRDHQGSGLSGVSRLRATPERYSGFRFMDRVSSLETKNNDLQGFTKRVFELWHVEKSTCISCFFHCQLIIICNCIHCKMANESQSGIAFSRHVLYTLHGLCITSRHYTLQFLKDNTRVASMFSFLEVSYLIGIYQGLCVPYRASKHGIRASIGICAHI